MESRKRSIILSNITEKEGGLKVKDDATIDNTEENFKENHSPVLDVIYFISENSSVRKLLHVQIFKAVYFCTG